MTELNLLAKQSAEQVKHQATIAKFNETQKERVELLHQEGEAYSKTKLEIAMGVEARRLENEFTKASIGLNADELAQLTEIYEARKLQIANAVREKVVSDEVVRLHKEQADQIQKIWDTMVKGIQRSLGTGLYDIMEGNFSKIGIAFKQMLEHMIADALAANIAKYLFGGGKDGGAGIIGDFLKIGVGAAGAAGGAAAIPVSKGAWFDHNVANFGMGGVVNSATAFRFASGGVMRPGIMGESGPEAIMPLKRDASGRLGVAGAGGSGSQIIYSPTINVDSRTDRSEVLAIVARGVKMGNADLVDRLSRAGAI
jgi:phage-related minor tail protein